MSLLLIFFFNLTPLVFNVSNLDPDPQPCSRHLRAEVTISRHLFVPLSPEVTIRPKALQGEVNWAMGAEAAIAPSQRCGNLIRSQAASMPEERKVPVLG